jgi:hypothetical protein
LNQDKSSEVDRQAAIEKAQAAKNAHEAELMSMPNVVGVGIGFRQKGGVRANEVALVVMVTQKLSPSLLAPDDAIPAVIDGVPVDVQEVGVVRAQ